MVSFYGMNLILNGSYFRPSKKSIIRKKHLRGRNKISQLNEKRKKSNFYSIYGNHISENYQNNERVRQSFA